RNENKNPMARKTHHGVAIRYGGRRKAAHARNAVPMIALHALRDSPPHVLRRPSRPAKGNCPGASAVAPFARGGLPALPRGTFGHRASIIACGKPQRNLNFLFVCMLPPAATFVKCFLGAQA